MPPVVVDLGVAVLILAMTYALRSEGLWGAALMFFNVLFAGLIAFNFYEPLAGLLASNVEAAASYAEVVSMLLIFAITQVILRIATESIGPIMVRFPTPVYHLGRIFFALAGACVTMAILLLGFHLAPIHKKMFYGAMDYDRQPPFGMGLDRKWLGFFQFTTGKTFANYGYRPGESDDPEAPSVSTSTDYPDYLGEYYDARVFDPRGRWLIDHQNARPVGEDVVPEPLNAAPAAGPEGAAPGGEPGMPGMPPPPGMPGPGIPGGTAGAAAGLAPTTP
jgi:hypothetical protein